MHEACTGDSDGPVATPVEISSVPIVVESTAEEYFVLYVSHDLDAGTTIDVPVSVILGTEGTTTLAENVAALPKERYRVEKYLISDPADVDGDCIDDITELADPVGMNPVNPAPTIKLSDAAVAIPDRATLDTLALSSWVRDNFKFLLLDTDTDRPSVYFANANTHPRHSDLASALGLDQTTLGSRHHRGTAVYFPELTAPDGSPGVWAYWIVSEPSFRIVDLAYTVLAASIPLVQDDLAYYMQLHYLKRAQSELSLYRESRLDLRFAEELWPESFIALNPGAGYGLLRVMDADERPNPRDVVVYESLPNDLPRVAGVITTVPQTPLSHVNLRAVQDRVPNAFIRDAIDDDVITDLVGSYVRYTVTEFGYDLRAATRAEVDANYASLRPAAEQTPQRDLTVTSITPLSKIVFDGWDSFGVKAANVAVLGTLGFPDGTVPDGFAVPFYFYDEFMKANGFYDDIKTMLADPDFQADFDTQESELKKLRKAIRDAPVPAWITEALTEMHASYPAGQSLRYRSSTNNEDLPDFNGAGLYDSKTQHADEEPIAKSLKQVYASMWTFRAFIERDFHRVDHLEAAMGVLVHPNYTDELVNGVAVSFDPIGGTEDYYVNSQTGEDLVTNPDALSVPEEIVVSKDLNYYGIVATSNQAPRGQLLMSDEQVYQLRDHLGVIHDRFAALYGVSSDEQWAIEVEFKITSDNNLAIKQARPWIFNTGNTDDTPPDNTDDTPPDNTDGDGTSGPDNTDDTPPDNTDGDGGTSGTPPDNTDGPDNTDDTPPDNTDGPDNTDDTPPDNTDGDGGTSGTPPDNTDGGGTSGAGPGGPEVSDKPAPVEPAGFTDVDPHSAHAPNIDALFAAGITKGCSTEPRRYCPDKPVTRAQMASFLARALNLTTPDEPAGFTDIDPHSAHAPNINALFAAGITKGCDTEPLRYCPSKPVTRAQMASFLTRALQLAAPDESADFTDVDPGGVHSAAINALFAAGITKGCDTEPLRYCPDKPVTRAQMASFLARALQLRN